MKIALDAGHGFIRGRQFTGAHANGLIEDELALELALRIGHYLRLGGHKTVLTRYDARIVPLAMRGVLAARTACDFFLSIHCNSGPSSAQGVEAFVAAGDMRSKKAAQRIIDSVANCGMHNRGVKWDSQSQHSRLRVLRDASRYMPAVLLEIGFLTNTHDAALLRHPRCKENISAAVAEGII